MFWEDFLAVDAIRSQQKTTQLSDLSVSQLKNLSSLLRGCRRSGLFNSPLRLVPVIIFQHVPMNVLLVVQSVDGFKSYFNYTKSSPGHKHSNIF